MGQTAQALGIGPEFEFQGSKYRINPLTFEGQAKVESHLEERAWAAARRSRRWLPPDEYREAMAGVRRDVATGLYSFGSRDTADFLRTLPGVKCLLGVSLEGPDGKPVSPETVEAIVTHMLEQVAEILERANDQGEADDESDPTPPPAV